MSGSWRWMLVVAALLIGAFAFACDGGDDNGNGDDDGDEPTAEATTEDGNGNGDGDGDEDGNRGGDGDDDGNGGGDGDDDGNGGGDAGGDAFEDVPLPDGAKEGETLTMSGAELPIFVPPDADVDAESFDEITMKTYDVDSSPEDVAEFYKDNRGDWDDSFSLVTSEGGLLIWTKDGQAVWITISESYDIEGNAQLVIIAGQQD